MAIIDKPSDFFTPFLWTGNGATTNALTGVGFKPDLVWGKCRSNANENRWTDVVRGVTKEIYSDLNAAQSTTANGLKAFGSDGFTVGDNSGWNGSSRTYASWNWKASNSQGSSNTAGSINTTYTSVNTTAGFSINQYTGNGSNATVGHGLGVAPKMVIVKKISGTSQWYTYHASLGATKYLDLQSTAAESTSSANWNNTAPTTTVFSLGTNSNVNASGQTYIAYCFAEVKGFSQISKYIGNGNADGTFIYTGFKPAFVMFKKSSATGNWFMMNNKMFPANGVNASGGDQKYLYANTSNNEQGGYGQTDILSNGFKFRSSDGDLNGNGVTYIYMAFASNPFVATSGSTGVPVTAR